MKEIEKGAWPMTILNRWAWRVMGVFIGAAIFGALAWLHWGMAAIMGAALGAFLAELTRPE